MVQQPAAPADPRFPLFHGVPAQPTNFVGREEILDRLVTRLTAGGNASVSAGGTGGAGKTTLAVMLAYDARILAHFTEGVLWAALGKAPTIEAILGGWASALGLDVSSLSEPAERAQAIKNAVGMRSILFIIDDVWDEPAATLLRCGGPNCAHLLTTRDDGIARTFAGPASTEKIPELEPDPAFELLQSLAPEVCAAEPEAARALVQDVGGLPLAIELLGGYLGDPEHAGLAGLRTEALREMSNPARRLQLARERLGGRTGERPTLEQTIALSLDDLSSEVVRAFYALGAFAPKPDTFGIDAAELVASANASCFGILLKRNLVESVDGERLSIHPVIAEYAHSRMPSEAVVRHRETYISILESNNSEWRVIEREYAQVRHVWSRWDEVVEGKIDFLYLVQDFQRLRGLWRDRITWTEAALDLARRRGNKHDVAVFLSNLGVTYNGLGQRQKALECYDLALHVFEEVGARHGIGATLNNIGTVYWAIGQGQEALEYYERALQIREELGDRQGLAATLNNIGTTYNALGQPQKASEVYERVLPILEEVGNLHTTGVTLNNIGTNYRDLGQRQKALEYYERALAIQEAVGDRRGLGVTLSNIGGLYSDLGQRRKALEYYERGLPILEEVGDRRGLAIVLRNVGLVYGAEGQRQDAIKYIERALPILEEIGGLADEAMTRFDLGMLYREEGRLAEAVEQFRLCSARRTGSTSR